MRNKHLKILHIGNIANNAYNNAKILNKLNFKNDVLSADYFHIMGCPEWEELDIQPSQLNDFNPEWYRVNKDFDRPVWFVQGNFIDCLHYLIAKNKGFTKEQKKYWNFLKYQNKTQKKNFKYYLIWIDLKLIRGIIRRISRFFNFNHQERYNSYLKIAEKVIQDYNLKFPDRSDKLTLEDVLSNQPHILLLDLLKSYDLIFCYGASTILPASLGFKDYVGFEHGTLRDIPWLQTSSGRLTALSYSISKSILMTNADSVSQAQLLNQRIHFGQHGFIIEDSQKKILKYSQKSILNDYLKLSLRRRFKILQPTRQDWKTKGNDKFLRALSQMKRKGFDNFDVLLVSWGEDIDVANEFIKEHHLDSHIFWIPTLSKPQLLKLYTEVDLLVDQFNIPCIGSTPLEIFSVKGAPLITSLDDNMMKTFYGRTIPLLNCHNIDDIYQMLEKIFLEEIDLSKVREDCYQWLIETHSEEKIVSTLLESQGFFSARAI